MHDLTDIFLGSATLYVDEVNVGWTRGGLRMRVNKSLWGRPSFSGLGETELIKQSEEFFISTVLVEATLLNLKQAWGINEAVVGRRIDFGGSVTVPTHALRFVTEDNFMQVGFYKVVAVDFGELSFSRKSDSFIPVTFKALLDTTKAVGAQVGYIIRGGSDDSDLVCSVTVPKIKTSTLYMRATVAAA